MDPKPILAPIKERWQALPRSRQVLFTAAAAGLLATVIYLAVLITQPAYAPLFTGLEPKQAGKIAEELKNMKIPYRLEDEGKTISVPEGQVYSTRIQLASKGILADSGAGWELFDRQKFGVTDFEQQVNYQRALQEELRRTITSLDEVEQARVHLVLPRESLFLDNQVEPSASIALKLKGELKPEQVKGIMDLVVGSVQGMKPENVHIIDMEGNVLSDNLALADERAKLARLSMDQYQVRRQYEKELETRIQQMLTKILGPNKAVAMVTADLDFDQRQTTTTTVQPGQTLSQQTITESGSGTGAGGVPGTPSSQPGSTVPALTGGNSQYQKQQTITNYQLGSQQQTLVAAPGTLRRLSVAVVLNGNYSAPQLQQIQDMVSAAVGLQQNRGDQINVSAMPFNTVSQLPLPETAPKPFSNLLKYWPVLLEIGALLVGLLLLLLLLVFYLRRRRRIAMLERPPELVLSDVVPGDESLTEAAHEPEQEPLRIQELREFARHNPAQVAEVLKLWLRE
ncbi:flagellar basal-body MS-ring/collar protein FliF [Desulfofundulus thermosubterraneus]|uniref:Flagellar M-ring protein n=1 Tax=Desulfofundulus thermosubterraneus DSM 16057 TaxID=1121432 RepID=A0A1M6FXM6_9FIRM|nr:flagellar basal-body MS-ring/collar protein FliF [Desulfofundulus thermosubterraneus]SHJ02446.1 flagellar M-ring protein FliF [Desulfofundulus thermosubterraneus DSM 16057]